jgi:outer membrane protein OmpA-like peptidoglycan-associated protein
MKLGQERAMVVAHYLVDKGVAMNRMEIQSMGATEFVAPNTTAAGRAKNRRTEILFYE